MAAIDCSTLGWWMPRHENMNKQVAKGNVDLIFIGDSITQGWGGRGRRVDAPGAEAWQEHFSRMDVANYGISGDRTQHILWRIDHGAFQNSRCRVVVLMVGISLGGPRMAQYMAERADEINAELSITSQIGDGTKVQISWIGIAREGIQNG